MKQILLSNGYYLTFSDQIPGESYEISFMKSEDDHRDTTMLGWFSKKEQTLEAIADYLNTYSKLSEIGKLLLFLVQEQI